ncbi:MAG: phosphonate ABC transporter, permease protein PhnE [Thermodesulfobacteriota bacterium]
MLGSLSPLHHRRIKLIAGWSFFLVILAYSWRVSDFNLAHLVTGFANSCRFVLEMLPPDFSRWPLIMTLAVETLAIGFWGTVFGTILALPLGFLSARNTSGHWLVYFLAKNLVNILRAIPDLIYALLFFTSFGLGPLAGVAALTLATVGLLGKFYAEAIESIDTKPVEALEAAGSRGISVIRFAVAPQIYPLFVGYNLYLLDHNIRAAMVLGLVGAGGLGVELFTQMRTFDYHQASAILLIILVIITAIDRVSAYLRHRIIAGSFLHPQNRGLDILLLSLIGVAALLSLMFIPISLSEVTHGLPLLWNFLKGMFPPDFSQIATYGKLMVETVGMGFTGTFLAVVLASPLGMLSAKNMVFSKIIYNVMKEITNFLRAMPELMFALIFIVAVGLGPFAGVLALGFHTAGFLGKFYAEAIENIDSGPVEAIEAVGSRFPQKIRHGVWTQVMPLVNSYNLNILDRNIRGSTIMGIVGAGGIGFELVMSMKLFEYRQTASLILVIMVTILIFDWFSAYLRGKII